MRQKLKLECAACNATGVYVGFLEPPRHGKVCMSCAGSGYVKITPSYGILSIIPEPTFQERKERSNIDTIIKPNREMIPYEEWKNLTAG